MSDQNAMKSEALFTIFEKHLYDFEKQEETEAELVDNIVNDYVKFLTGSGVAVPRRWQNQIIEELRDQVRKMLVKKVYGCLTVEEFLMKQPDRQIRRKEAKKKYSKLY